jgi:hypothetical protein
MVSGLGIIDYSLGFRVYSLCVSACVCKRGSMILGVAVGGWRV